jgi:N-methylhydantoinase B
VVRDVVWRKVSPEAALADYGVVLTGSAEEFSTGSGQATLVYDERATAAERAGRVRADEAFFDRGPGYAELAGGAGFAAVDVV